VSSFDQTQYLGGGNAADMRTTNLNLTATSTETERLLAETEALRIEEEAIRSRQEMRAARDRALGTVAINDEDVMMDDPEIPDNDRIAGSLGLACLRLVLAAFLGLRGVQVLFNIVETSSWLAERNIPISDTMAWALGLSLVLISFLLIIGFGVRLAGLLTTVLAVAVLVFLRWGFSGLLVDGEPGFIGDVEVLVAGLGLTLLCLGSGGLAIDAAMRSDRAKRRQYE